MKLVVLALVACGPKPGVDAPSNASHVGTEVYLFRDRAMVAQQVEFDVPPAAMATVRVKIAANVEAEDIVVFERDRFTVSELHVPEDPPSPRPSPTPIPRSDDEDEEIEEPAFDPGLPVPKEIEMVIGASHAGHYAVHLGYLTDRINWDAAYTMTTTPARDRATVRGALSIKNATGIALPRAHVRLVDAELGPSIHRAAELVSGSYVGAEPKTTQAAPQREIGVVDLVDGETRVELLAGSAPRKMRSVLIYDPIGTDSDRASAAPVRDVNLGVDVPATSRVRESFEVSRDVEAARGLPAGPVRLLEQRSDGALAVLGEARLFEASTRVAEYDAIAIGTADGVIGHRERREYTYDELRKRLSEDFMIQIDNARSAPVEVVIREHLYRGQNWTLAYRSVPIAQKEGPQQISMRMIVPPKSQQKLLYVVVYTWP